GAGKGAVERLLLRVHPVEDAGEQAGRRQRRLARADAERALRMGMADEMGQHVGQRQKREDGTRGGLVHFHRQPLQVSSSRVAKILLMSLLEGSSKKASVSVCWFMAMASSGSGRTTARAQPAGRPLTVMFPSSLKSIAV